MTYPILDPHATAGGPSQTGVIPGACALAMMIKAPRPGASKTRLSPPLTPEEAAALSGCFLRDTTANIAAVAAAGLTHTDGEPAGAVLPAAGVAVYTPTGMERAFDGLLPEGFCMVAQCEGGFGARLVGAVEDLLAVGYGAVCLIDSDSPTLPAAALAAAVRALSLPGDRVVLGPSEDGGYYLIGVKKAHRRLFEDITWSTEHVARETLARADEINLETVQLPTWYDVDDAPTLRALCDELFAGTRANGFHAPQTRAFLAGIIEREGRERIWPDKS